ncbi:EpsG family protein [Desulfosporosinus sp. OT]|uniref:EpsG family protein n=1 Tax=Desulfosporosinus sp. OT TaxID=913865 RepID=UPI000223A571|nr:EpsG family protein [Desulfosporosinus sp. OT]EGW41271.1 putative membrane protein [Desulfosporosinus sp. OT]
MWPYLVTFFISAIITKQAERSIECNEKKKFIIFSFFAILLPALLAGLRGENVGTDTMVYGIPYFNQAVQCDSYSEFAAVISNIRYGSIESSYLYLVYIISRFTDNVFWLFFIINFLTTYFVYKGIYRFREHVSMPFGMLVYYFILYNVSLNLMRQLLAAAIVFYSINFIVKKDFKKYVFCMVCAIIIHGSAVMGIFFYVLYRYLTMKEDIVISFFKQCAIIVVSLVFILLYSKIVLLLVNTGILTDRYIGYIGEEGVGFSINSIIKRAPYLILILCNFSTYCKKNAYNKYLTYLMIIELFVAQLSSVSIYAYRLSIYFLFVNILTIPQIPNIFAKKSGKLIIIIAFILYLFLYWFYSFIYTGGESTYPYVFSF